MSQQYYFKNLGKNEYIKAEGNGAYSDFFYGDTPEFITWVMLNKWLGKNVMCVIEHEMPRGYDFILKSKNVTDEFRAEFNKSEENIKNKLKVELVSVENRAKKIKQEITALTGENKNE